MQACHLDVDLGEEAAHLHGLRRRPRRLESAESNPIVLSCLVGRRSMVRISTHECSDKVTAILACATTGEFIVGGKRSLVLVILGQVQQVKGLIARDQADANGPE